MGVGDLLPCCDPEMDIISQIFSNDCSYCISGQIATNNALMQNSNNQGNTSGVPCCDPSQGFFSSLLSNTCNQCNPIGAVVGLPSIPTWAWIAGLGVLGFILVKDSL